MRQDLTDTASVCRLQSCKTSIQIFNMVSGMCFPSKGLVILKSAIIFSLSLERCRDISIVIFVVSHMKQMNRYFSIAPPSGEHEQEEADSAAVWRRNAALLATNGTSTRLPRCEFGELFLSVFITYQGHWPSPSLRRTHHRHDGRGGIDLTDGDLYSDNSLFNICHHRSFVYGPRSPPIDADVIFWRI